MCINSSVTMIAGSESHLMDQLDENLRELKRRVDARMERLLIEQASRTAETEPHASTAVGSPQKVRIPEAIDFGAYDRPALPLPQVEDPTVINTDAKLIPLTPLPRSVLSLLQAGSATVSASESSNFEELIVSGSASSAEHEVVPTISQVRVVAHPPAIRRQGVLQWLLGKLLPRKT
jgi:hypothetical protein